MSNQPSTEQEDGFHQWLASPLPSPSGGMFPPTEYARHAFHAGVTWQAARAVPVPQVRESYGMACSNCFGRGFDVAGKACDCQQIARRLPHSVAPPALPQEKDSNPTAPTCSECGGTWGGHHNTCAEYFGADRVLPLPVEPPAQAQAQENDTQQYSPECSDGGKCGVGGYCDDCHWPVAPPALPASQEPVAWAVESNISGITRAITKLTTNETEADRYVGAVQAARAGCERSKIPLCRCIATPQPAEQVFPATAGMNRDTALGEAAAACWMNAQTIRLHAGELTSSEMRAVQAVLTFVRYKINGLKSDAAMKAAP